MLLAPCPTLCGDAGRVCPLVARRFAMAQDANQDKDAKSQDGNCYLPARLRLFGPFGGRGSPGRPLSGGHGVLVMGIIRLCHASTADWHDEAGSESSKKQAVSHRDDCALAVLWRTMTTLCSARTRVSLGLKLGYLDGWTGYDVCLGVTAHLILVPQRGQLR